MEAVMGEVQNWPGVECMLEGGRKHGKMRVAYNGVSRVMLMPKSPSDHRAPLNQVTYLRRVLREVGAIRISKEK
jgi:hypothetical protein